MSQSNVTDLRTNRSFLDNVFTPGRISGPVTKSDPVTQSDSDPITPSTPVANLLSHLNATAVSANPLLLLLL
jgi:hypothetical protein